jgi:hypothetical protein
VKGQPRRVRRRADVLQPHHPVDARVTRLPGVFQEPQEAADAINRLNSQMVKEGHEPRL